MVVGGWVLDFTRLMLISTQVEVEVGGELGNNHETPCTSGKVNVKKITKP